MIQQLHEVGFAVFVAFSLHGEIDCDEQNWKCHRLNRQQRHTECGENSWIFSKNTHGTMLWMKS